MMDDGSKSIHGQIKNHTEFFTKTEVELLQTVLNSKFKIQSKD